MLKKFLPYIFAFSGSWGFDTKSPCLWPTGRLRTTFPGSIFISVLPDSTSYTRSDLGLPLHNLLVGCYRFIELQLISKR
ncbi:hypothetical protein CDAR_488621 [Caerostris darwini]|uniref:Uncharacterized protein n=1 Tax=Caerostris darwini TaxID=1538125 RepID=A0AAV4SCI2_9ARAC|nr:hypothetical protein CDAR_488621 [Caerostris darwini]